MFPQFGEGFLNRSAVVRDDSATARNNSKIFPERHQENIAFQNSMFSDGARQEEKYLFKSDHFPQCGGKYENKSKTIKSRKGYYLQNTSKSTFATHGSTTSSFSSFARKSFLDLPFPKSFPSFGGMSKMLKFKMQSFLQSARNLHLVCREFTFSAMQKP